MATPIWRGDAPAVAQVNTVTPANVNVGNTFSVTINGKSITVTATAATVANVTGLLAAAIAASTIPEFQELAAVDSTTHVTLTANVAGVPFTQTSSASGGTATNTTATATAGSGPNHWNVAENWSTGAVPVDGDDVFIANSDVDILYGLDQSSVQPPKLAIDQSFTGRIGLPVYNDNGYYEYRETYLRIGPTTITIGQGTGTGSRHIKLNTGSDQTTLNIGNTGSPETDGLQSVLWKGTHAANQVNVNRGSFGAAVLPGETATIATLRVGFVESVQTDATVRCGAGVTLTTVQQTGGRLETASAIATMSIIDGELIHLGGAISTLNLDGGAVRYRSSSTLGEASVGSGGTLDFRQDMRARTVTSCNLYERGELHDPFRTVTWTNGIDLVRSSVEDVTLDIGTHLTLTPADI